MEQTKLVKFLEGLQPSPKNLAVNVNPKIFDESIEQAQLDEFNSKLTASEVAPINNFSSTSHVKIEDKLIKVFDRHE